MIVIRWGRDDKEGKRDLEFLFDDHEEAQKFHTYLVESESTTYTHMEEIEDE